MADHPTNDLDCLEKWAEYAEYCVEPVLLSPSDLKALIAEMREARVIAKSVADCEIIETDVPLRDTDIARYPFTMGEIRAARAFLARTTGEGHE